MPRSAENFEQVLNVHSRKVLAREANINVVG